MWPYLKQASQSLIWMKWYQVYPALAGITQTHNSTRKVAPFSEIFVLGEIALYLMYGAFTIQHKLVHWYSKPLSKFTPRPQSPIPTFKAEAFAGTAYHGLFPLQTKLYSVFPLLLADQNRGSNMARLCQSSLRITQRVKQQKPPFTCCLAALVL